MGMGSIEEFAVELGRARHPAVQKHRNRLGADREEAAVLTHFIGHDLCPGPSQSNAVSGSVLAGTHAFRIPIAVAAKVSASVPLLHDTQWA